MADDVDIRTSEMIIEVETSATIVEAVERLSSPKLPSYVAVTNKEGINLARKLVEGTGVGVMDPQGNIIVESLPSHDSSPSSPGRVEDHRRIGGMQNTPL